MKIAVFGLGYVGACTAACLAKDGHSIIGVDPADSKREALNSGRSPILEASLDELISNAVEQHRLSASHDFKDAVLNTDMAFVCVGTPSKPDGTADVSALETVCKQIGACLSERDLPYLVVVRSTVLPGTTRGTVIPILEEASTSQIGNKFDVVFHPEFLREGSSVYDFFNPPKIVAGCLDPASADSLMSLYSNQYPGSRVICDFETAEVVKYSDNAFHALKISFANEIDRFCNQLGIDGTEVMEIFCRDDKLNISTAYLKPGFAFGGSCLPKDLRALTHHAEARKVDLPVLSNILESNNAHLEYCLAKIKTIGPRSIGLYGLAFKPGTDDLRESPAVDLAQHLLKSRFSLKIFDELVIEAKLTGRNKTYIDEKIPVLSQLLVEDVDSLSSTDLIVLTHPLDQTVFNRWSTSGNQILDLSNIGTT